MTAAEIADKLRKAGGDTASLSPGEQELLMRALRTWDELLAALKTITLFLTDLKSGDPDCDPDYLESVTRDAIACAEAAAPHRQRDADDREGDAIARAEAAPRTEPKIVKRVEAATLEEGLTHRGGHYWTEIVTASRTWVVRPDGSLAGVVKQV